MSDDNVAKVEEVYIDSLINGARIVTKKITKLPGEKIIESVETKRAISPRDCLEYLRTRAPEKWSPPPVQQAVLVKQETLNIGIDAVKKLLTPIEQELE